MGAGASSGISAAVAASSPEDLKALVAGLAPEDRAKIAKGLEGNGDGGAANTQAEAPTTKVKVYGMPVSANSMTAVLLAMHLGVGGLEMCNLMEGDQNKPEFLAMNPYHHIPTVKDGDVALGESIACLHYLALKYNPALYPPTDPTACARIDFALSSFRNEVYIAGHQKTVYPVLGFAPAPEDQAAATKVYTDNLDKWTAHFLKGKFVNGDSLSIADFYAVPFLFSAMQPGVFKKVGFKPNDRAMQYVDEFCAAVSATAMLREAGGYALAEYIASKVPDAGPAHEYAKVEYQASTSPTPKGSDIKVHGLPASANAMGPILLAMDLGVGGMEMCDIMNGAQNTPEFLAMNPFHHIPTVQDGDVALGESSAIMHYLALKYKPEFYPSSDPAACAKIDFAMDSFECEVYAAHRQVVYPIMGFAAPPADQEAANKKYTEALDAWTTHFLEGKFVCGDKLTVADFKAVPYLFAAMQPGIKKKTGFEPNERAAKYVNDVCEAVKSTAMLKEAGGFSLAEYIASKTAD